ncbi:hypothetical protein BH10ACI1_BH10ACI1_33180 [soil metagenome]
MKSDKKKNVADEKAAVATKPNKNLYAILGVIVVLALIGGGYWWFTREKKTDCNDLTVGNAQSPTEAYKMLYASVKCKNPEKIKMVMSENSIGFAGFVSGQQKKTVEEVLANGFTATTFSETLPQMRDERIKDNFGALEVWNSQDKKWEDVPFILEASGWKAAFGDMFKGNYERPDIGQSVKEQLAANAANNNLIEVKPEMNANANNVNMIIPKNVPLNKNVPKPINPTISNVNPANVNKANVNK